MASAHNGFYSIFPAICNYWQLYSAWSPPSGMQQILHLCLQQLAAFEFSILFSYHVQGPHTTVLPWPLCSFHRSLINSPRESNIYHLNSCRHTLLLLKHKNKTPLIHLTHTKFNTLREGINGPNFDILNREWCDDTGF